MQIVNVLVLGSMYGGLQLYELQFSRFSYGSEWVVSHISHGWMSESVGKHDIGILPALPGRSFRLMIIIIAWLHDYQCVYQGLTWISSSSSSTALNHFLGCETSVEGIRFCRCPFCHERSNLLHLYHWKLHSKYQCFFVLYYSILDSDWL